MYNKLITDRAVKCNPMTSSTNVLTTNNVTAVSAPLSITNTENILRQIRRAANCLCIVTDNEISSEMAQPSYLNRFPLSADKRTNTLNIVLLYYVERCRILICIK